MDNLLKRDSLSRNYTDAEKEVLFISRHHYKSIKEGFEAFLAAIDWSNPEHIREMYKMVQVWEPLTPEESITLLDADIVSFLYKKLLIFKINQKKRVILNLDSMLLKK